MSVDAPTASRQSVLLAVQLALSRNWKASIGDIRAAFLTGVPAPRQLYFSQPRRGIPSMGPGALVEIYTGVFGLATSPKLWRLRLSSELRDLTVEHAEEKLRIAVSNMLESIQSQEGGPLARCSKAYKVKRGSR